jgi:GNAT superfamily N-acetyltransferase
MNSAQDVKLRKDGVSLHFKFLEWDTNFFRKRSFMLDMENSVFRYPLPMGMKGLLREKFKRCFLTAKIDNRCGKEILGLFQDMGFRYVQTELVLEFDRQFRRLSVRKANIQITRLTENKGLPYGELGSAFCSSRFHSDTRISKKKADLVWVNYLKNYKPSKTALIYAALHKGKVVGVILVNLDIEKRVATLFFIAVKREFRGRNVGSMLIQSVARALNRYRCVIGTQVSNIGALNFYIKNGFSKIISTKAVFHKWG